MKETLVLLIAMILTLVVVIDFTSRIVEAICKAISDEKWGVKFYATIAWGIIAIVAWCVFYYL